MLTPLRLPLLTIAVYHTANGSWVCQIQKADWAAVAGTYCRGLTWTKFAENRWIRSAVSRAAVTHGCSAISSHGTGTAEKKRYPQDFANSCAPAARGRRVWLLCGLRRCDRRSSSFSQPSHFKVYVLPQRLASVCEVTAAVLSEWMAGYKTTAPRSCKTSTRHFFTRGLNLSQ